VSGHRSDCDLEVAGLRCGYRTPSEIKVSLNGHPKLHVIHGTMT